MRYLLFLIVLCIGCSACTGDEPAQKIDLSKREAVEVRDADDAITYAYLPQYSHSVSYLRHNLLVEYLKKETGYNIGRFSRNV